MQLGQSDTIVMEKLGDEAQIMAGGSEKALTSSYNSKKRKVRSLQNRQNGYIWRASSYLLR